MNEIGIYIIKNNITQKIYVGSSAYLKQRKWVHFWNLKTNKHCNSYLQNAYNKYGVDNFTYKVIENCNKEDVVKREQYYIDTYKSANPLYGYNISPTAASCLGAKRSDETKRKLSISAFNRKPITEETRLKLSLAQKGKKRSIESIEKAKISLSKVVRNKEWCNKISATMKGRPVSDEMKNMLRTMNIGKKRSEEAKIKAANSNRGRKRTEEQKERMRNAQKGKIFTKETINKIRLAKFGKYVGGEHGGAKKIINKETGEIYDCIKNAAANFKVNRSTLTQWLKKSPKNKPKLDYYNEQ